MASEISKPWLVVPLLLAATYLQQCCVYGVPQVPCLFIFGDSLSDGGNNNHLPTDAKVNYKPYGIDFPYGQTGRFTNGRTSIDIISQFLGFDKFIPPFANTAGSDILKGVNYASGAAGIRPESGKQMGDNIDLGAQLANHLFIVSQMATKLGGLDKVKRYLNKCLYYVNIGSNDYINNYFMPQHYPTSSIYTLDEFAEALIQQYSLSIRVLRALGAKKFVLVGLGLIGCTPNAISNHVTNGSACVEEENRAAFIFNDKLKSLVDQYNNHPSHPKFIFVNSTAGGDDLEEFGFKFLNAPCCAVGWNGQCAPEETPCQNRNQYVFFDGFHPTETANILTAIATYNGSNPAFTYPLDIYHLIDDLTYVI